MRRSLAALFFVGSTITLLSCGPSEADLQREDQARRDSLAQALAQREATTDTTRVQADSDTAIHFTDSGRFVVQVGAWRSESRANSLAEVWKNRGYPKTYVESSGNASTGDIWFRVRLGRMSTRSQADALVRQIQDRHGLTAWVDILPTP